MPRKRSDIADMRHEGYAPADQVACSDFDGAGTGHGPPVASDWTHEPFDGFGQLGE